jgi:hypothetical protein
MTVFIFGGFVGLLIYLHIWRMVCISEKRLTAKMAAHRDLAIKEYAALYAKVFAAELLLDVDAKSVDVLLGRIITIERAVESLERVGSCSLSDSERAGVRSPDAPQPQGGQS